MFATVSRYSAIALLVAVTIAAVTLPGQSALACGPEVKFDPETGLAIAQPELEQALAEILEAVNFADARR